ncbi:MAG: hypothetical protein LBD34_02285 [Puniceicoccales bacterium]|nr:hypothetical protein [Puniceicoccales bacterium]
MAIWLMEEGNFERLKLYFPKSQEESRVGDRRIISGIVYVFRSDLKARCAEETWSIQNALQPLQSKE